MPSLAGLFWHPTSLPVPLGIPCHKLKGGGKTLAESFSFHKSVEPVCSLQLQDSCAGFFAQRGGR